MELEPIDITITLTKNDLVQLCIGAGALLYLIVWVFVARFIYADSRKDNTKEDDKDKVLQMASTLATLWPVIAVLFILIGCVCMPIYYGFKFVITAGNEPVNESASVLKESSEPVKSLSQVLDEIQEATNQRRKEVKEFTANRDVTF